MAARGNLDDVQIKVKIDTSDASASVKSLGDSFNQFARDAGKRLGQAGFGVLAGTAAGLSAEPAKDLFGIGRGITGVFGREFSRTVGLRGFAGQLQSEESALDRTVQAFGLAGKGAVAESPGAVEGVYKAFQRIEGLRVQSRQAIEDQLNASQAGAVGAKLVEWQSKIFSVLDRIEKALSRVTGRF